MSGPEGQTHISLRSFCSQRASRLALTNRNPKFPLFSTGRPSEVVSPPLVCVSSGYVQSPETLPISRVSPPPHLCDAFPKSSCPKVIFVFRSTCLFPVSAYFPPSKPSPLNYPRHSAFPSASEHSQHQLDKVSRDFPSDLGAGTFSKLDGYGGDPFIFILSLWAQISCPSKDFYLPPPLALAGLSR